MRWRVDVNLAAKLQSPHLEQSKGFDGNVRSMGK